MRPAIVCLYYDVTVCFLEFYRGLQRVASKFADVDWNQQFIPGIFFPAVAILVYMHDFAHSAST